MSDYVDNLVRQWELNDPRDRWRHTGEEPTSSMDKPLPGWKPMEEAERDLDRMLICSVCGADACFGFGATLDGVRMGDVGDWRCSEHHPTRKANRTREEWERATMPADRTEAVA